MLTLIGMADFKDEFQKVKAKKYKAKLWTDVDNVVSLIIRPKTHSMNYNRCRNGMDIEELAMDIHGGKNSNDQQW